jgi:hypothetical protein
MTTKAELQQNHETLLNQTIQSLAGQGAESDWALVRALVHKAVHLTAERRAGEFCALATLLAEMTTHAHEVMHTGAGHVHSDFPH